MATYETGDLAQYLTFSVAGEEYGVSVLAVREILEYGVITRVPGAPAYIRGVMNLRGRVVPLVDLAVRFGLPAAAPTGKTCVVVVDVDLQGEKVVMGLVADAVSQVIELGAGDIEAPPPFGATADTVFLSGMGRAGKRFVLILDIERVLNPTITTAAAAAAAVETQARAEGSPANASMAQGLALVLGLLVFGAAPRALAQEPIKDNSFLIEEAYNQDRGMVQHINTFSRASGGDWVYTFTQEWPVPDQRHQLSFTLPVEDLHPSLGSRAGIGDLALNYRYQAVANSSLAISPRLSLVVPTGRTSRGLGAGGVGLQLNLPASWSLSRALVTHWNAGMTHTFAASDAVGRRADTNAYSLGQGLVWLARPRVNFLVEASWTHAQSVPGQGRTIASDSLYISPGIRWSYDVRGGLQIVPGIAFPIGVGPSRGQNAVFLYLSFEHPFLRIH